MYNTYVGFSHVLKCLQQTLQYNPNCTYLAKNVRATDTIFFSHSNCPRLLYSPSMPTPKPETSKPYRRQDTFQQGFSSECSLDRA